MSGPSKGQVLPVDVDAHINAILEFVCGAQVTLTCSFDVWDSELPRMENLCPVPRALVLIDRKGYRFPGPNLFGGDTLRHAGTPRPVRRWGGCRTPSGERKRAVAGRAEQPSVQFGQPRRSRSGIGLVDLVYALEEGRGEKAACLRRDGAAFA